jgi:hypothetical protein
MDGHEEGALSLRLGVYPLGQPGGTGSRSNYVADSRDIRRSGIIIVAAALTVVGALSVARTFAVAGVVTVAGAVKIAKTNRLSIKGVGPILGQHCQPRLCGGRRVIELDDVGKQGEKQSRR